MRWFLVDKFVELDSGKRATAVKNVTLAEDYIHDHFPGYPCMPHSLIIEVAAQTGGLLTGHTGDFQHAVVLAKIERAVFHRLVLPGDTLHVQARMVEARDEGSRVAAVVSVDDETVAEIRLMFANVELPAGADPARDNFVFSRNFQCLFKLNKLAEGTSEITIDKGQRL